MNKVVWKFETANFTIQLRLDREYGYQYDGDDENGETQSALDCGDYVAFDSTIEVVWNDTVIGSDSLGGSVYDANEVEQFWTAHRDTDPMNRNCTLMRDKLGNASICHYFPDMVRQALKQAREHFADMPKLRAIA